MELEPTLTGRYRANVGGGDRAKRKSRLSSLVQAVFIIAVFLFAARFITVLVLSLREEPVFTAPKTIYLPQRELEHQMAVAEFQNAAATPATIPALTTENLLATMPVLPQIPNVDLKAVENEAMVSESDALFGQSGLMGALGALSSQASSVSFLGITEEAKSFVIVLDVSESVVLAVEAAGLSFNVIREEAESIINKLNANTRFGFILHGRKYIAFQNSLVPATVGNKKAAIEWLRKHFNDSGDSPPGGRGGPNNTNGLLAILGAAFEMQPDAMFLVSNGGYFTNNDKRNTTGGGSGFGRPVEIGETLNFVRERQKEQKKDVRIHSIHFFDPRTYIQDERIGGDMRRIATANSGKYRKISR
ncbi:MAG: hypothetical protein MK130_09510 [Puniceicoccaceae bacterium]|nr:hypothetical protein [Puniceicoccaceae bacterium]